ncbi:SGNH/GDSL hydrolase family protein [Mesorhizobium sp. NPDC059054]|uniref:SGNH/GDSL hydrolase family protein n=1 Tax=Mesorhizobium sp. NPDC059054 TaxID=3346711 RepID=UPI003686AE8D
MSRIAALLTWFALPVYVWQGIGVRRRTTRMLPASGPVMHEITGRKPPLSLLVLGDSSAASVGIGRSEDGLAAQLATLISEQTGQAVRWRAAGFNSATSGQIRDHVLPNLSADAWTHIVLCIGTNDTKNFHSVPRFKKEFGGLLYALRAKWPEARVVWSPVLEFTRAPAMPPLLGKILEIRAQEMNRMGTRLCYERGAVPASRLPITNPQVGFASDGFHASAAGYRAWAEHLLRFVLGDDEIPST